MSDLYDNSGREGKVTCVAGKKCGPWGTSNEVDDSRECILRRQHISEIEGKYRYSERKKDLGEEEVHQNTPTKKTL